MLQPQPKFLRKYYRYFIVAIFVMLSPVTPLYYILPIAGIFYIGWSNPVSKSKYRNIYLWILFIAIYSFLGWILTDYFSFKPVLFFLVTFSSFLFLAFIPTKKLVSSDFYAEISRLLLYVIVIESVIGLLQYIYGVAATGNFGNITGDWIEGTNGLFSGPDGGETKYFVSNMLTALIVTLPWIFRDKKKWFKYWVLGFVVVVLASTIHLLFFVILSFVIVSLLFFVKLSLKYPKFLFSGMACLVVLIVFNYQINTEATGTWSSKYDQAVAGGVQKVVFFDRILIDAPKAYPYSIFFGFGPGQLGSLANLISTEMYFGSPANPKDIPLYEGMQTIPFKKFYYDLWYSVTTRDTGFRTGSTFLPYSSWSALFAEFGLLGVIIVLTILFRITKKVIQSRSNLILKFSFLTGVGYIFLIGLQLNYWEMPQAIFIGCMSLHVMYANIVYSKSN